MPMANAGFTEFSSSLSVKSPSKHKRVPKTGNWGPSEDFRLRQAVSKHGPRWVLVAEDVGTRNGDQCAKRWKDKLNPELDHSQWSPDEDERLLNLVDICGHNWKFMAQNFFQSRAPLSLKNRNSLLMRRLKRQATGGGRLQQQVNIDSLKRNMQPTIGPDRYLSGGASPPYASSMTGSPETSPVDATDMANFLNGNETVTYSRQDRPTTYEQPSSATNDFQTIWASRSPSSTTAGGVEAVPGTYTPTDVARQVCTGNARMMCSIPFLAWGDQDLTSWPQNIQSASTSGSAEVELITGEMGGKRGDFGWGEMPITPQRSGISINEQSLNSSQLEEARSHRSTGTSLSEQGSKGNHRRADSPPAVEYSVTCRRGKVRALINHLMDAGISEISERVAEDDNVTIKLRIEV